MLVEYIFIGGVLGVVACRMAKAIRASADWRALASSFFAIRSGKSAVFGFNGAVMKGTLAVIYNELLAGGVIFT